MLPSLFTSTFCIRRPSSAIRHLTFTSHLIALLLHFKTIPSPTAAMEQIQAFQLADAATGIENIVVEQADGHGVIF